MVSFKYDSKQILIGLQSVFTHAASIYANSWGQKKAFKEPLQDLFGTPTWPPFHCSGTAIGRLNNDNGDVNENVKTAIGLDKQNNNFACASNFFFPSLHDYDVKVPNFTFCGGREHKTTNFFFLFLDFDTVF